MTLPRTVAHAHLRHSILHVVDTLEFGGLERMVADIACAQREHGHAVAVFSLTGAGDLGPEIARSGVEVIEGGKRGGFDLAMLARLRTAILRAGAHVVHTHNFVPNYYAALAIAGVLRRRPALVNTCHNMGTRLAGPRLRRLYRLSLLRTARVAGVGEGVARHLVERGLTPRRRTVAVRNGVRMPPQADAAARRAARSALGIGDGALLLGTVGRLVELKNHRLLLDQVAPLAADFPRLRLVLIGDGPLREELQARTRALGIDSRVHFTGARDDVARLLPALDAFVLPSRTEGLSIALLEACAAGLPVVASAVGGNPEIIEDGHTGLLVPSDDAAALQAGLRRLLADDALRHRLGCAARAWVNAHASLAAVRTDYDALYAQALGSAVECG
ncbi:MAG TPA: glycosyltransferase [Luteimonas sp.]